MNMIHRAIESLNVHDEAILVFKVNGLTDKSIIKALYKASQAGVKIRLYVRTLCSLKPGIKDISDNIRVISVVGRFLEHHRVFYIKIAGKEEIYCGSADLMDRNLYHRIEILFPILDPVCFNKIKEDIINNYSIDDSDAWIMQSNGSYTRNKLGQHSAQEALLTKYRR